MTQQIYTVLLEEAADGGWSAHVPDLPTILVGADSREEAASLAREAVLLYLEDLKEQWLGMPSRHTQAVEVEVAA